MTLSRQPTKHEIETAIADEWRKWGGWPAVESGMVNMTGVLADRIMALYASPSVPADTGEPVAWRWRYTTSPVWHYIEDAMAAEQRTRNLGYEVQPLYRAPAPASSVEALRLLVQRVEAILGELGPGGYLVPAGAVKTNALEAALNEARAALSSPPQERVEAEALRSKE
jgi:hypothetical protein